MSFLLKDYSYALPEERIAQFPAEPRDHARLMVVHRKSGQIEHRFFCDLPEYLDSSDLIVANNTRVMPARLLGRRIQLGSELGSELGGKVEFLLLEKLEPLVWEGAFHASAKHKPGVRFKIPTPDGKGLFGELIRGASESENGTVVARFDRDPIDSGAGEIPLPHYMGRPSHSGDAENYQTVYSKELGSAAAPTAGLHFTPQVIEALRMRGVEWVEVTLHVGVGTFRPVKSEDIRNHVMHEERFEILPSVAHQIEEKKKSGGRVVAVGTTSVRTLESAWQSGRQELIRGLGRTRAFLHPGGAGCELVDRLITNFHLPQSTLLMLVSAFAGRELVLHAYEIAVREKYRFFSYGDAMLIL